MLSYRLKTLTKSLCVLMSMLLGFSHDNCVGVAPIVIPLNENGARSVQATGSVRIKCVNRFLYQLSLLEGHLAQQRMLLHVHITQWWIWGEGGSDEPILRRVTTPFHIYMQVSKQ